MDFQSNNIMDFQSAKYTPTQELKYWLPKVYDANKDYLPMECIYTVIAYFFEAYSNATGGCEHMPLKGKLLRKAIDMLEYPEYDEFQFLLDFDSDKFIEAYRKMIDRYFQIPMDCDYSIFHFLSGKVRELRFYETCYYE